jgi:hypothetical protein
MQLVINFSCYLCFCIVTYYSYPRINLLSFIDNTIEHNNKILSVRYIQVNYMKSLCLMLASPFVLYTIYCICMLSEVPYTSSVIMGGLYAALDMSALLYNPVCHSSTYIHHVSVQILYLYCIYYNWAFYSLSTTISLYACFSTLSYVVNYRLSIRNSNNKYEQIVNDISLLIYCSNSIINWVVQFYFIIFYFPIFIDYLCFKTLYILSIFIIINDDIFLMKYLYKNISIDYYNGFFENWRCYSLFKTNG